MSCASNTLHPNAGDGFGALSDAKLVLSQAETGMMVLGRFRLAGRAIKVRFHWTKPARGRTRWAQAHSHDDGNDLQLGYEPDCLPPLISAAPPTPST